MDVVRLNRFNYRESFGTMGLYSLACRRQNLAEVHKIMRNRESIIREHMFKVRAEMFNRKLVGLTFSKQSVVHKLNDKPEEVVEAGRVTTF